MANRLLTWPAPSSPRPPRQPTQRTCTHWTCWQECLPAVPDRQRLTQAKPTCFDHLPKHQVATGPAQATAAMQADAGPVSEDRRELIISQAT
jgi:hypothetical protein